MVMALPTLGFSLPSNRPKPSIPAGVVGERLPYRSFA